MSDTQIKVPVGMKEAAMEAWDACPHTMLPSVAFMRGLEAALRWQKENPPVLTDEMWHQVSWDGKAAKVTRENVDGLLRFIFSRMYLSPEPEVPEEIKDAKRLVLAVWPGAKAMPDASGVPSADYCIVRPATKEDWPENKWVQVGPYVSGDPWEAAASLLRGQKVGPKA